ncbi:MAG: LLM class flavin-dependent oxidoreductase [Acidimicrobiia bacterium]|nr:LLM class flavin-dependent oxidoreductase [Acidimicrobiia bacterium]
MRIALEVWSSDFDQVLATCHRAEELGLDGFYYGESPHDLNLECWATLAALAQATTSIRLGPVVTNVLPSYRSTTLLIRQAAAVAAISGGRLDLRTGVGAAARYGRDWWEPQGVDYPGYDRRLADLEAMIGALDAAHPDIPTTIAATGQRAMNLAATRADGWETSFCTPAEYADRNRVFSDLARDRTVVRSLEIDGFLATTSPGRGRLLDRVQAERGGEDLAAVLSRALVGTPEEAAVRMAELAAAGVDQLLVALHDPHDPDALQALARSRALLG